MYEIKCSEIHVHNKKKVIIPNPDMKIYRIISDNAIVMLVGHGKVVSLCSRII